MKRIGSRGSKQWKEISWPRAIEEIASNISSLRAKGTPEKLAAIDGNFPRSTMALLIKDSFMLLEAQITSLPQARKIPIPWYFELCKGARVPQRLTWKTQILY